MFKYRLYNLPKAISLSLVIERMSDQLSAESLKDKGNEAYKKRDYEKAIEWYTQSLHVQPTAAW